MREQVRFTKQSTMPNKLYVGILAICGTAMFLAFFAMPAKEYLAAANARSQARAAIQKAEQQVKDAELGQKVATLIERSDEYDLHKKAFVQATMQLLRSGRCAAEDFAGSAGWTRSVHVRQSYFVYCGEMKLSNRIYLNVVTNEIFQ